MSETQTVTLVEWLTKILDEDEATAKAAPGCRWQAFKQDDVAGASVYDEQWVLLYPNHYDHDNPLSAEPGATGPMYIEQARDELCAHIARHDPAAVLADIAAKRKIVNRYREAMANASERDELDPHTSALLAAFLWPLWDLATAHADRPGFDESWRT